MTLFKYRSGRARPRLATRSAIGLLFALLLTLALPTSALAATPTPVLLGTTGDFAVLAGSGITNTGPSTISGDVGSSPTPSETGFAACPAADCVALTGTNHTAPNPNDTTTQNAKADLITAYNNAAGQIPVDVPTELAGQTLVAGVYHSSLSGTFGMTGTLVLDGQNNADATFIFQTDSTLITGGTGNVSLIRGAQACNVFWKVGSAATLGGGSTFRGTILAHDDISVGNGVTVDGRLLAGEQGNAGAVTLIHDTISKPSTCRTAAQAQADAAAAKAAADAKAAEAKAVTKAAAKATAAKAAAKAKTAKTKTKASKTKAKTKITRGRTTSTGRGFARPPRHHVGLTG